VYVTARTDLLDFASLGVLSEGPLHGYALRKALAEILGPFRALSYGSLYPCLRRLQERGWIEQLGAVDGPTTKRARVVYALTGAGKDVFVEWANQPGSDAWDDESFATRLAFFSRTEASVRLRILEGRRSRMEERLAVMRESMKRGRDRMDTFLLQMQEHGVEGAEREVSWLDSLILAERNVPKPELSNPPQVKRSSK
jgi:DNA-binding PadR family transcriptional regulator